MPKKSKSKPLMDKKENKEHEAMKKKMKKKGMNPMMKGAGKAC